MIDYQYEILVNDIDIKNNRLGNIINEFDRCFLLYRDMFSVNPDIIEFSGGNGKILYSLLNRVLSSTFNVSYVDRTCDEVRFRSGKTPTKKVIERTEQFSSGCADEGLVPYTGMESVYGRLNSYMSFSPTIERDVETFMDFHIKILKY